MLLIVGWSSVVFWLNVRPRLVRFYETESYLIMYGCPWIYAAQYHGNYWGRSPRLHAVRPDYIEDYWALTANIAIGLVAVAVLTFASKYLVRAIVAGVKSFMSKPPPANEKGD